MFKNFFSLFEFFEFQIQQILELFVPLSLNLPNSLTIFVKLIDCFQS